MKNISKVLFLFFLLSIHSLYGKNTNTDLGFKKDGINAVAVAGPDASLGGPDYRIFNNKGTFSHENRNSSSPYLFTFKNTSTTASTNTSYTIDWGDGTPLFTNTIFDADEYHNYNPGFYTLKFTITGPSGTTTKDYDVYVGTSPAISLGNPGGLDICTGNTLQFPISGTENNSPNTIYKITFSDDPGNPQIYTQSTLPSTISHIYNISSCGYISSGGGVTYLDSFSASVEATNSCGSSSSALPAIYVSERPTADFNLPQDRICVNTPITIAFNSNVPREIINGRCQNSDSKIIWTISPASGYTLDSGSLGSFNAAFPDAENLWVRGTSSIIPRFTTPGTYTITMKTSNRCGVGTKTKTITIKTPPTVNQINNQPIKCAGQLSNMVVFDGNFSTTTYNWTNDNPTIGLAARGTGNIPAFTLVNPGTTTLTANITVTPTTEGCPGTPISFTITVLPTPILNPISNITLCNNTLQNDILFGSSVTDTPTTFTWTNSNTSIGLAASGTGKIPAFTATNSGTSTITSTITVTPSNVSGCPGVPITFTITVYPTPENLDIMDKEYCGDIWIPETPFTYSVAGTTYSWQNDTPSIGLPASGIGSIPTFKAINNTSNPITATITFTPSANGCSGTTKTFKIKVYPALIVNFSEQNQTICSDTPSTLVTIRSTTNGVTFRWNATASNPAGITGFTQTSGTDIIPVQTFTNTTDAPITITYVAEVTGGTICVGALYTYTITINPRPRITNKTAITCSLNTFSVDPITTTTDNVPLGTTYSWANPISTPSGAIINGASATNSNSISQTVTNTTTIPATLTYTVTPNFNGCDGNNFDVVVTVKPKPIVNPVPSIILCPGDQSPLISFDGNILGTTYNWSSSSTAIGITSTGSNNIPVFTAINNNTTPLTATITITPTLDGCEGDSKTFTITVNPTPTVIVAASNTTVVCNNQMSNSIHFDSLVTGTTFSWTNSNSSIGLAASGTGDIPSFTAINTTNAPINAIIRVTPTANNCSGTPIDYIITVNPTPTVNQPASQEICNGLPTTDIIFDETVANTSYTWINNKPSIGLGDNGSGNINSFTAINDTPYPIIATITVTPWANGCSGTAKTFTITVNPSPAVVFSNGNQTLCSGQRSPVTNLTSLSTGVDFSWTTTAVAGISGLTTLSGTNQIPTETLINTTSAPITITYLATGRLNGSGTGYCQGITYRYTITVNPIPSVTTVQAQTICSETSFAMIPQDGSGNIVPANTFYTWSNPIINPAGAISGGSANTTHLNPIRQTLTNTSDGIATATYTVTPIANGCSGQPFPVVITVNPSAKINFSGINQTLCNNGTSAAINLTSPTTSNLTFNWTAAIPNGITGAIASGTDSIPAQTLTNTTTNTLTVAYTATATFTNGISCPGNSYEYKITVYPELIVSTNIRKDISCFGSDDGKIDINVVGGSGTYTYSWTKDGSPFSNTEDISNLKKGFYEVTVNDSNSCGPKTASFTIEEPPLLELTFVDKTDILCFGDATGAINVNVIGGRVPAGGYHFAWTGPNGFTATTQNLINIPAGIYTLIVTDDSGCTDDLTVETTQPAEIMIATVIHPIFCYGGNDGAIDITVSGGVAPYTKTWDNLGHGDSQDNLSAGTYKVTVTDANSCIKSIDIIIPDAPIFTINPVVKQISCFGEKDGSINLNIVGGVAPLTLKWDDNPNAGNVRNNLKEGTYSVTITDAKSCVIKRTFVIQEPQLMVLSANVTNALDCDNANSGSINLLVAGGTAPFTYQWNYPSTTEDLNNIPAGNYMVTVTDARGCIKTGQYTITRPDPIAIKVSTETFFDCDAKKTSQKFVAQASGGVPPFKYNWSNGDNDTTIETDQSGMVILTVTDALGCKANYTLNIKIPTIGKTSFETSSIGYETYGKYSIVDPIQFTNTSTGDFSTVAWDFGDGAVSTEENPKHSYQKEGNYTITQTVSYSFGCVYTYTINLKVVKGYEIVTPNAFTPNGDGVNETFKPAFEGLSTVQLDIYNSWGELIYTEKGTNLKGWDGRVKGMEAPNGNYYYKLRSVVFYGTTINDGGTFTLIK